jgi:hypothetical protein
MASFDERLRKTLDGYSSFLREKALAFERNQKPLC